MITQNETLILGIGNTLLSDEGAGIHALNLAQSEYSDIPNITFLDGGTLSFTLASWIEDCDNLIVFDAAQKAFDEVAKGQEQLRRIESFLSLSAS